MANVVAYLLMSPGSIASLDGPYGHRLEIQPTIDVKSGDMVQIDQDTMEVAVFRGNVKVAFSPGMEECIQES